MNKWILLCLLTAGAVDFAAAATLRVRHDHDPFGECRGELTIDASGVRFASDKPEHSRDWNWIDLQSFDRRSDRRFSILTWEDQVWKLGRDRYFDFTVPPDAEPLDEETFRLVRDSLKGWVVDRIAMPLDAEYSIAVKHLHALGGCQGTLRFGGDWIVFESDNPRDSRTWRRGRDVESFWSSNPYRLEIHVFEETLESFEKNRRFQFQLKERLDPVFYRKLRRETLPPY